jgi:tungstate transport system ATP-binding protein
MTALLEIRDLLVHRDGRPVLAIERLTVEQGEVLAVLGPNGAGKTTLLLVLARLLKPEGGEVRFRGRAIAEESDLVYRRRVSLVMQEPLLLDRSVFENVAVGLRFRRLASAEVQRRVGVWLGRLGIAHLRNRPGLRLSGGEAQRVALARALVLDPELLLLDEPFGSVDETMRNGLLADLRSLLAETHTTTLFITHDPEEVDRIANRAVWLEGGRLVAVREVEPR